MVKVLSALTLVVVPMLIGLFMNFAMGFLSGPDRTEKDAGEKGRNV